MLSVGYLDFDRSLTTTPISDILTDSSVPEKKSKAELEQLVKANGGKFYQTSNAAPNTICVADRSEPFTSMIIKKKKAN